MNAPPDSLAPATAGLPWPIGAAKRPAAADLRALVRHFPFTTFLVVFLPLLADRAATVGIAVTQTAGWLLPFVCLLAAGYAHNNAVDLADPAGKRNPVAAGRVTPLQARSVALGLALLGGAVFALAYHQPLARLLFAAWVALLFGYNGCGLRLKETWLGPLAAVVVLWVGGPLVLAAETGLAEPALWWLLAGALLVFLGRETWHTLADLPDDRNSGWQTFAVRAGPLRTARLHTAALVTGCLVLLASIAALVLAPGTDRWAGGGLLVAGLVAAAGLSGLVGAMHPAWPGGPTAAYALARLSLVAYAVWLLGLPAGVTVLLLWLFLTCKLG